MVLESSCLFQQKKKFSLSFKGNNFAAHNDQNL